MRTFIFLLITIVSVYAHAQAARFENGIGCKRLVAVGFGSTKPIAANDSPANKSQNKRMEFIPAALGGKAIGGLPLDGGGAVAGDLCN